MSPGITLLLFGLQILASNAEFFSSTSGLEQLLRTELILMTQLQIYVNEIREHADILQA